MVAETTTGSSTGRSGRGLALRARVPHQDAGSACGTSGSPWSTVTASRASRRAAASRSAGADVGVGHGAAQLGDDPRQRQRPHRAALHVAAYDDGLGLGPRTVGLLDLGGRHVELVDEPGRLLAVVLGRADRGDQQPLAGPGAGDVEQPALLGEQGLHRRGRQQPVGADPVGLQQRRAPAQVGPALLLDVRHHDEPPLQALGPVRGEQPDRVAAHAALGERVGGDLLRRQRGQEVAHAGVAALLLGLGGHLEQRAQRVEVAVRHPRGPSPGLDAAAQPVPPVGAVPQQPEHLLGGGTGQQRGLRLAEQPGQHAGLAAPPGRAAPRAARGAAGPRGAAPATSAASGRRPPSPGRAAAAPGRAPRWRPGRRAARPAAPRPGRLRGGRRPRGRRCRG